MRKQASPLRQEETAVHIRHILAPLDFSSPSLDAVEYAIQLANGLGATVTLMHVLEPVCYDLDCGLGVVEQEARKRDHWNRQLAELQTLVTSFGLAADVEISGGIASDAILASALRSSLRSDRDGDPWPPRRLRGTVRKRGGGGVAPGDLSGLNGQDAEIRRGPPSDSAASDE
jgi:hypothetical protein